MDQKLSPILIIAIVGLLAYACGELSPSQPGGGQSLGIGYAEVNYTPRVGLNMVGNYRGDDYASRGIHDSLYAKAIVAAGSNGVKTAVISVDICNIKAGSVEYMRNTIAEASDLDADHILIHATHTHSGPESKLEAPEAREYLAKSSRCCIVGQ